MDDGKERLDALLRKAIANLAAEASDADSRAMKDRLPAVAAELALEWISGERRFENQSQQTEHWLSRLYEALYPGEQPDATRIYARFGLPLPRAQYLTRLLLARRTGQWRDAARNEAIGALETIEEKSREAVQKRAGKTQRFELSLSRGGYEQLVVRYDLLAGAKGEQDRPVPLKRTPSSGSLVWFSIAAETAIALLEALRKERA